ncbi:MAG: arsenosugar biosynthesis arsenite methyltransferase ArsM [Planctomycetota bacterium]
MTTYHDTVRSVYADAAAAPAANLCCVPQGQRYLPELTVPVVMHEMNYGCGTTVHLEDMRADQRVLYVGVGGGLEALQLAYFTRRPGGVVAVDPVAEMREAARVNLEEAARLNPWFDPSFVEIVEGDALALPAEDQSFGLAAQNCLFNIFKTGGDLEKALDEMHRVLKPGGALVMSDPITPTPLPERLADDERLRAQCISGCLTYEGYMDRIVGAGFGAVEVRSRRPYRLIDARAHDLPESILLETLELSAYRTPVPADGACVFTGRSAVYHGPDERFDDGKGHVLVRGLPLPVCDKTAGALAGLGRADLTVTDSTWHYAGGGCC